MAHLIEWLDEHMREIMRGSFIAFIVKVAGAAVSFALNVFIARVLGAEGAGIFFLALSIITIASVVSRLGLDNTLLRFTASNASSQQWAAVKGATEKGLLLTLVLSLLMTLVIMILAPWAASILFSKPELGAVLFWMALSIMPMSVYLLYAEMLRGLKMILPSQVLQGLIVPLANFALLYLLVAKWGVLAASVSYLMATLLAAIVGLILWRAALRSEKLISPDFSWGKLFESCMPLYGVALLNEALVPLLPYMVLGYFRDSSETGIFAVATRTCILVGIALQVINSIAAPKMAELFHQGEMASLKLMMRKTTLLMIILTSPVLLVFMVFPEYVMSLFGEEFRSGSSVLAILAVGQSVNVICGPVGYLLIMSGNERLLRRGAMLSALVLVVMTLLLVDKYGAVGAAIGSASALVTVNLISVFYIKKQFGGAALWSRYGR